MIKRLLILMLIILTTSSAWSWDKSKFDISIKNESLALKKMVGVGYDGQEIKQQVCEMTLIQGGYFTVGTNQGLSPTNLDDQCGITFGHPYALTSYPLLSIDGSWGKPETFFNIFGSQPTVQGDSMFVSYLIDGSFQFLFSMKPESLGQKISLTCFLKNLDTQDHSFGMGLIFDPGLGKKGDGWIRIGTQTIQRDTLLSGESIPTQLMINERMGQVDGMKLLVDFGTPPDKVILANWKDVYQNHEPDFLYSPLRKLYDLTMKIIWSEQTIPAGGNLSRTVILNLQQPDFNTPLFMRWDLPGFLSIENHLLFPRSFDSFVEINNLTSIPKQNSVLKFQFPDELFSDVSNYELTLAGNEVVYQRVKMRSKESYEDKIIDLLVTLENNGQLLDSITRQVYMPAIPVSDTGLVCMIDTVMTSEYPQIKFTFEAQVEATGQRLFNLTSENVFLYENDVRIKEFTMGKDTTGGVTMADIVFVLDCSGSMGDDIQAVKNNINEFCDSLIARGVDFMLGLVTFSTTIDDVYDFNNDVELFKSWLDQISLWGGRENSLGALYRATELSFRPLSKRTFVWITDEDYPVYPEINLTVQDVVDRLLLYDVTVHSICEPSLKTQWCNPIIEPTGGNFYDIHGNFRDILLDISRVKATSRFLISYTSPGAISGINHIKIELHYAGLGGIAYAEYNYDGTGNQMEKALTCYPNPFNPTIQIAVDLDEYSTGTVEVFNILGQRVRSFSLDESDQNKKVILWDARDSYNHEVNVGTYFVRLKIFGKDKNLIRHETAKILYLK
jgi:Mg-chelatase subunit ChlD